MSVTQPGALNLDSRNKEDIEYINRVRRQARAEVQKDIVCEMEKEASKNQIKSKWLSGELEVKREMPGFPARCPKSLKVMRTLMEIPLTPVNAPRRAARARFRG